MTRKSLPSAAEIWEQIPLPAMAQKPMDMNKAGLHVFRICEGIDIYNNNVYIIECRDIFGMATEFTQENSGTFNNKDAAIKHYTNGLARARKMYKRLKKQYDARGGNYD